VKTLFIIRPDAILRGLVGEILTRFERHSIRIAGLKVMLLDREKAGALYEIHKGKPFYENLVSTMTSDPVIVGVLDTDVLDNKSAIALVRKIVGSTDPSQAEMGTIRGDFGLRIDQNIIHASDSVEAAAREIPLFFKKEELVKYKS
jgi:nucleoside-diphosphate kinase